MSTIQYGHAFIDIGHHGNFHDLEKQKVKATECPNMFSLV